MPNIPAPPTGHGPPLPVIQQHEILVGQNPPPPPVAEHSIPNITLGALISSPQGCAHDPPRTDDRRDVLTTPPNAQVMPAIKFASQRHTEKFNRLHALLAQRPSFLSITPRSGEVILEGQQLQSSNFSDLLSTIYQNQTNQNVRGQKEFLKVLAKIFKASSIRANTLPQYVSSKEIINELIPQVGRGRKRGSPALINPPGYSVKVYKLYP